MKSTIDEERGVTQTEQVAPAGQTPAGQAPGAERPSHQGPTYEINIEGRLYEWHEATITPQQIRDLGGLPADQPVIEIDFRTNTERTLAEGVPVEVKPGHGYGKKIGFKRGMQ